MEADGWGYTDGTPGPVCSGREGLGKKKLFSLLGRCME
jgi:hypothetical protein